jgi:hypothetical protein
MPLDKDRWREVAKRAAAERDPERLLGLVKELNRLLEEAEKKLKRERGKVPGA